MTKKEELQNQIHLYSLETIDFYTDEENELHHRYMKSLRIKSRIKKKEEYQFKKKHLKIINKISGEINKQLKEQINKFKGTRSVREDAIKENKVVSLFESSLTRTCKIKPNQITDKLVIIRIYHYDILNNIIKNGFVLNGEKYQYFTSSAGQIRTKKIVCINSEMYEKYENSITCGLTPTVINEKGGVNTNKYQAYLALISSASAKWSRFNIDRVVVVDDICTDVFAEVDHIDRETYEIERKEMYLPIEHMDGCGIMLPSVHSKTFMFRMPWMKGMVAPFDFKKFALEHNQTKITDIYGKEFDIIDDNINIILTKSQFKMWKYYDSWDDYKRKYKEFQCEASRLNIEDIGSEANINYQMLQTLVGMTEEELTTLAQPSIDDIVNLGTDKKTMLRVLGATKQNKNKNNLQKALLLYPELLSDNHAREVIKNKKKSLIKDGKSGKLRINGHYTFIIPDLYAFCEWLFLGEKNPNGLLKNKEVYCNIFNEGEVDVLRAPHLYKEHAIRNNILDEKIGEWFITQGIYTSFHDPISRILQFDNDGDKALVVQDETLIEVAKREMDGIVPLYYEMAKAEAELINTENMYNALTSAYKANIGIISNDITKIWNSPNPDVNAVKWLTMYNNFVIDFAKTLFLPKPPEYAEKILKSFTKNKVPHFFKYAKDKEDRLVESAGNSTVDKLENLIPDKPIRFIALAGKINHKKLMKRKTAPVNPSIIEKFEELSKKKRFLISQHNDRKSAGYYFNTLVKEEFKKINNKEDYIADVLIEYLYVEKKSKSKDILWDAYGHIIVENLESNLKGTIVCEDCLERFKSKEVNEILCKGCKRERQLESKRKWKNSR
jgi:hypothetical protein